MNAFLSELALMHPDNQILLVCVNAVWHKSAALKKPSDITIQHTLLYTPEMNPMEQIRKEVRNLGFRHEVFATLENVADCLFATIFALINESVQNIIECA